MIAEHATSTIADITSHTLWSGAYRGCDGNSSILIRPKDAFQTKSCDEGNRSRRSATATSCDPTNSRRAVTRRPRAEDRIIAFDGRIRLSAERYFFARRSGQKDS
jgi:hypothetical protein